jgi:hypothetical protein
MPLSVIGAGLGRTGTMSLKLALEQLGFGPCHHMVEVFKDPAAPGRWCAAAEGGPVDWETMFAGYRSTVDWPSATFWRELAEAHPEAKVILTVRDPEAWFRSTQATIMSRPVPDPPETPFHAMIAKVINPMFGGRVNDRDTLVAAFNAHNAKVRAAIAPERLLVYEVAEGWEPLCAFLGVPVPGAPMPVANTTEEFLQADHDKVLS